ncbi:hypothetical protein [Ancylomarina longa]|uniref:Uncharacterized protein n=1 Tax=Ancylomarina longa TaxID=2487017 RepID=A0A434AW11_9BACT|nr:hypothetical protein [Ancylomarina longa]RUT78577.1 hypothetical protein DLK05_06980 [Ancylomarina longa]
MQKNLFDLVLTAEEQTQIDDALKVLDDVLLPKLHILSNGKKDLLNMGDKSIGFVDKAYEVARQETDLLGGFIDLQAFNHDVTAIGSLRSIEFKLSQLHSAVEDSFAVAGSEAYNASLMVYSLMKNAAKMGHPGAKDKVDEMSARFPGHTKKKTDE